jgi:hypothetical protein
MCPGKSRISASLDAAMQDSGSSRRLAPADCETELSAVRPQRETWTLLIATTPEEVRYELSVGDDQDAKGRITSWSERILFPPLEIDQSIIRDQGDEDDGDGLGDIDVPVVRR